MKKKFLLVCMLIIMSLSLVACGDDSDSDDNERRSKKERENEEEVNNNSDVDSVLGMLGLLDEESVEETYNMSLVYDSVTEVSTEVGYYESFEAETVDEKSVVTVSNPVFFEQDDIKMTFVELAEDCSEMKFIVENKNQNKNFNFRISKIRINNIGSYEKNLIQECVAGTINEYTSEDVFYGYNHFCNALGISEENRKIYEIIFDLEVKIGSDSKWETRKIVLKTDDYIENYKSQYISGLKKYSVLNAVKDISPNVEVSTELTSAYQDVCSQNTIYENFENFNIYYKSAYDGIICIFENNSNIDLIDQYSTLVFSVVAGEKVYYFTSSNLNSYCALSGNGGMNAIKLNSTVQNLRSEFEIPNDVPLSLMIAFNTNDGVETHFHGYLCLLE